LGRVPAASVWCLSAIFGAACGGSPPDETIDVKFDPCEVSIVSAAGSTPTELEGVDRGLGMWNEAAGLSLARDTVLVSPALVIRFQDAYPAFRGAYDDEHGIAYINRRLSDPYARAVTVAHEVGHAFGLTHVDPAERASLMNPGNIEILPTPDDVALLRASWGDCSAR
jgi:hypothetical protein